MVKLVGEVDRVIPGREVVAGCEVVVEVVVEVAGEVAEAMEGRVNMELLPRSVVDALRADKKSAMD
jgi:hypothetical protein